MRRLGQVDLTVAGSPSAPWHQGSHGSAVHSGVMNSAEAFALAKNPRIRAVYAHVPFCRHKCHYCDFYSFVDLEGRSEAFVARLEQEIADAAVRMTTPIETVFVGGGTPTLLGADLLRRALRAIRDRFPIATDAEWTVEANPETVDDAIADALVSSGVGRVSLGAQSFDRALLKALERHHDPDSVPRAVECLRRAGIAEINLDLIFGIPGSTVEAWERDLQRAIAINPDHVSAYGLVYEPNTPLSVKLRQGRVTRLPEELEADQALMAVALLGKAGYSRYEVSNWARPGRECHHNLLYWENADWWALGPSGSSHADGVRWKNVPRLSDWLNSGPSSPVQDVEVLDEDTRAGEGFMLGLRLVAGIAEARVAELLALGIRGEERALALAHAEASGLINRSDGRLRLSDRGMMVADSVLCELV